jgi:hypothetical protein
MTFFSPFHLGKVVTGPSIMYPNNYFGFYVINFSCHHFRRFAALAGEMLAVCFDLFLAREDL